MPELTASASGVCYQQRAGAEVQHGHRQTPERHPAGVTVQTSGVRGALDVERVHDDCGVQFDSVSRRTH
jgi:hypothetical protein